MNIVLYTADECAFLCLYEYLLFTSPVCMWVYFILLIVIAKIIKITFYYCQFIPIYLPQHASADVERMVLGNKCDFNDKRQVSKERGEKVGNWHVDLDTWSSQTWWTCLLSLPVVHECWHWFLSPFSCCQLALEYGIKFMETSAKANINVENVSSHIY